MSSVPLPPSTPSAPSPLLRVLDEKILPALRVQTGQVLVIAREKASDLVLPPAIGTTPHQRKGRRVAGKGRRPFGNRALWTQAWPEDFQESISMPLLACVTAGQADIRLGDYILHCPKGHFVLIPPGMPHAHGARPFLEGDRKVDGMCDVLWMTSRGHTLQCWISRSRGPEHHSSLPGENVQLLNERANVLFGALNDEAIDRHLRCETIAQTLLLTLALTVQREIEEGRYLAINASDRGPQPMAPGHDPIDRACQYILSHLNEPLRIDVVARVACLSRAQFTRLFRQQTGQSFVEYLSEKRLERACRFLLNTDWTVSYISDFVGYRSPSHFHQMFVSHMGLSPIAYRAAGGSVAPASIVRAKTEISNSEVA